MTEYSLPNSYFKDVFPNIIKDYQEHDKTCSSIPNMWLGRKGGFSDLWSQRPCDGCEVWFYVEGLQWYEAPKNTDLDDTNYCDCCDRKRQK